MSDWEAVLSRETIGRMMSMVGRATATKAIMPVLSSVLIDLDGDDLRLTATNLDLGVVATTKVRRSRQTGVASALIPWRLLSDFVGTIPTGAEVTLSGSGSNLIVTADRAGLLQRATFNGADVAEMPAVATDVAGAVIELRADDLRAVTDQVAVCAARDDSRPVLSGVNVVAGGGSDFAHFSAADGYRCAMRAVPNFPTNPQEKIDVIVPSRTLTEVSRMVGAEDDAIRIGVPPSGNLVVFSFEAQGGRDGDGIRATVTSRLLEGQFPDLQRVVPTGTPVAVIDASRADVTTAVKSAAVFAKDVADAIRLDINPTGTDDLPEGTAEISASATDTGATKMTIPAVVRGTGDVSITFSSAFFGEIVGGLRAERIQVLVHGPLSPLVIRAVDDAASTHVLMPMQAAR